MMREEMELWAEYFGNLFRGELFAVVDRRDGCWMGVSAEVGDLATENN
jgi:hypothetical protein